MLLDEYNCKVALQSYTQEDWQPLFEIISRIENTSVFRIKAGGKMDANGNVRKSSTLEAPVIAEFVKIIHHMPILIRFNWSLWHEGRAIVSNKNYDFDTLDLVTKCKLITAIVNNDKFCKGALVAAFESGLVLNILKSIKKQVSSAALE